MILAKSTNTNRTI